MGYQYADLVRGLPACHDLAALDRRLIFIPCDPVAGATKILFGVPIIYIILIKYSIAAVLTIFTADDFCSIAWDSAGDAGQGGAGAALGPGPGSAQ